MPILHIKALSQKEPNKIKPALKKTTIAIAEAYGCAPHHVWTTWEEIKSGLYIEGENEAHEQPAKTHPPICELICFEGKSQDQIESVLLVAAKTLSLELGVSDNIFITYREAKSGQVVAGDEIVRK